MKHVTKRDSLDALGSFGGKMRAGDKNLDHGEENFCMAY